MELDENQRECLSKVYNYLRKLAQEKEETALPMDSEAQSKAAPNEQQNTIVNEDSTPNQSASQTDSSEWIPSWPPLVEQARGRIEQAEAVGNFRLAEKHRRILKAVEGIKC